MKHLKKTLFIFRRDLRLADNTSLIEALKRSDEVIPCFIFDPRQIEKQPYRGQFLVQFMVESLRELDSELQKLGSQLYIFCGIAQNIIETLIESESLDAISFNADYTPFSLKRDKGINALVKKQGLELISYHDALLQPPGDFFFYDCSTY